MTAEQVQFEVVVASPVRRDVRVVVAADEVERATVKRLKELSTRVRLDGFRPGKAPLQEVRKRFGVSARVDAVEGLIRSMMSTSMGREDLRGAVLISDPYELSGVDAPGSPVSFRFVAEYFEDLTPVGYREMALERRRATVEDAEVDERVAGLRDAHATIVPIEDRDEVVAGDVVLVDYAGDGDGAELRASDEEIDLTTQGLPDGFITGLVGAKVGESKQFNITLPPTFPDPKLAGRSFPLNVTVKALRRKELPELNDEFVKGTGEAETVEEWKEKTRAFLAAEKAQQTEMEAKRRMIDRLLELNPTQIPELYLDERSRDEALARAERAFGGRVPQELMERLLPRLAGSIRDEVRRSIHEVRLLSSIVRAESLTTPDDVVDAEIARIAETQGQPVAKVRARYASPEARSTLRARLDFDRAVDFVWSRATITEVDSLAPVAPAPTEGSNAPDGTVA